MDNQKILCAIIATIKEEIRRQNLSQKALEDLCKSKGVQISQGSISNTLSNPSSAKVSTLLKICEGLDLSLFAIFRSISNSLLDDGASNLIYNINHPAFDGYRSNMYIYFCKTNVPHEAELLYGEIEFNDFYHTNECIARLKINTNELDENNNPKYKEYEGTVSINRNEAIYLHLTSNKLGDVWSLIFNHGTLNQNSLACSYGCGVTLSSGKNTRYPTIHYVCLCRTKLSSKQEEIVRNRLRIHNKEVIISDSNLKKFLEAEDLDPNFRENLESCTSRNSSKAYVVPLSSLSAFVDSQTAYNMMTRLLKYSCHDTAFRIPPEEDTKLFNSLKE